MVYAADLDGGGLPIQGLHMLGGLVRALLSGSRDAASNIHAPAHTTADGNAAIESFCCQVLALYDGDLQLVRPLVDLFQHAADFVYRSPVRLDDHLASVRDDAVMRAKKRLDQRDYFVGGAMAELDHRHLLRQGWQLNQQQHHS
jgi:hypothetical protein